MKYQDALKSAANGGLIKVTIVSNQDNGIVSYITGNLNYLASFEGSNVPCLTAPSLNAANLNQGYLGALFSDRFVPVKTPPGSLSPNPTQPFDYGQSDAMGITIKEINGVIIATFDLIKWKTQFTVNLKEQEQQKGTLLYGNGNAVGNKNNSYSALYVIAFTGTGQPAPK